MLLHLTRVGAALAASSAVWLLTAAPAGATIVNGTERVDIPNPYPVKLSSPGVPTPDQGALRGSGFKPGSMVYVQVCDGVVPSTSANYTPAAHCAEANAGTPVAADGRFSIDTSVPSFQFEGPFHGAAPQNQFNCLAPADNPHGPFTAAGHQRTNPDLPSWGSNRGPSRFGGGKAPCQLRFSTEPLQYQTSDIYVPLTGLGPGDPASGSSGSSVGAAEIAGPVAGVVVLGAVAALVARRRRLRVRS